MEPIRELRYWCKTAGQPSELGIRVAALLADWAGGGHHLEMGAMEKVDWSNEAYIRCQLDMGYIGDLSTFDFDGLTRLVFLAHDYSVRIAISPIKRQSMQFLFHGRNREGGLSERHPTIEQAVSAWRENHKEPH